MQTWGGGWGVPSPQTFNRGAPATWRGFSFYLPFLVRACGCGGAWSVTMTPQLIIFGAAAFSQMMQTTKPTEQQSECALSNTEMFVSQGTFASWARGWMVANWWQREILTCKRALMLQPESTGGGGGGCSSSNSIVIFIAFARENAKVECENL